MSVVDQLLGLELVATDTYVATTPTRRGMPRLFGGQVAAQGLMAACKTVPDARPPHSLHAYFVRAGAPEIPVHYHVDRTRDGRSFSTRHVTARQDGKAIFELMASFEHPEPGADWEVPTDVGTVPEPPPGPPAGPLGETVNHLEMRFVRKPNEDGWRIHPFWFRTRPTIGDDAAVNAAMLTFVSDMALMANAREPGTNRPMSAVASIDHALWFHRPPQVDNWLLFTTEPVANIGARGMVRGAFHTEHGQLVATVTQEALLRPLAEGSGR